MTHTAGRSGWPKIRQWLSAVSCTQHTPAGLPPGMPGMGDEIEGSTQHAPQPMRQSMLFGIGRQFAFFLPDENQGLQIAAVLRTVAGDDGADLIKVFGSSQTKHP